MSCDKENKEVRVNLGRRYNLNKGIMRRMNMMCFLVIQKTSLRGMKKNEKYNSMYRL